MSSRSRAGGALAVAGLTLPPSTADAPENPPGAGGVTSAAAGSRANAPPESTSLATGPVHAVLPDLESDPLDALPRDHPAWQRDMLAVSARMRAMLATLRPVAVRVLTFWDHARSTLRLGTHTLDVDLAGCYRLR